MLVAITADIANGGTVFLQNLVNMLRELLAAFLGQSRNGVSDDASIVGWIEAKVGSADGFLDVSDERNVVGLHGDERRVRSCQLPDLVYRSGNSVVIDLNAIQDRDRCPPRANAGELLANIINGFVHPLANLRNLIFYSHIRLFQDLA